METLRQLIKESRIENNEIITDDYVTLQDATFNVAKQVVGFGQCPHSERGTPNKYILELIKAVEVGGYKFKAMVFIDNSNTVYLNEDFDTALENADLNGWI